MFIRKFLSSKKTNILKLNTNVNDSYNISYKQDFAPTRIPIKKASLIHKLAFKNNQVF
ncbi:hypothetical protein VIBNISO65_1030043 [Vibrio nigripulchritudo SO65]|nr:hypothetical protein VIBNIFTn2_710018 [Vibrio nigripulchritudo FTn2]CCN67029.1 hypothetical protein VIBNIPon4_680043 [Vibrio nigripulchritudo POn4]CCN74173.1 hypothetical protein VIBNISO65_1030043 [Vibrio nigripulchritudo SO65]